MFAVYMVATRLWPTAKHAEREYIYRPRRWPSTTSSRHGRHGSGLDQLIRTSSSRHHDIDETVLASISSSKPHLPVVEEPEARWTPAHMTLWSGTRFHPDGSMFPDRRNTRHALQEPNHQASGTVTDQARKKRFVPSLTRSDLPERRRHAMAMP